jgi:hypothetical protein
MPRIKKVRDPITSREAKHGEKMIELRVRLWTDDIAPEKGKIAPKHAWAHGVVHIQKNSAHGIVPESPRPFNSLLDLGSVLEAVLIEHGITLHVGDQVKRYVAD